MKSVSTKHVCIMALLLIAFSLPSHAQTKDAITVHFDEAVAVPGNILAPGDYYFHVFDHGSTLNTIQITNIDRTKSFGYFQVLPTERKSLNDSVVKLSANEDNGVRLVKSWFESGNLNGYQFKYSQKDLQKVAMLASQMDHTQASSSGN